MLSVDNNGKLVLDIKQIIINLLVLFNSELLLLNIF